MQPADDSEEKLAKISLLSEAIKAFPRRIFNQWLKFRKKAGEKLPVGGTVRSQVIALDNAAQKAADLN